MNHKSLAFAVAITVIALAASALLYPRLPATIPLHWNLHGEVDGEGPKQWGVFLMPAVMVLLLVFFRVLPWLSPRRFEVDDFRQTYGFVMALAIALVGYLHAIALWSAVSGSSNVGRLLLGGVFLFLTLVGNVLGKVRRNFWIGVRTPWTLASERVWIETHRFSARLFVTVGLAGFLATLAGAPITATLALLIVAPMAPIVYSLVRYKRLEARGEI